MGRTLHYSIKETKVSDLTEKQLIGLYSLSRKYNTIYDWTCESVGFSFYDYYPNWNYHSFKEKGAEYGWKVVTKKLKDILGKDYDKASDYELINAIKKLKSLGLINMHSSPDDEVRGFTKVRGNELNANQVIKFILESSTLVPNKVIYLHDEGDALYCPLLIKNGKAKPDKEDMESSLEYWNKKENYDNLHNPEVYYNVIEQEKYYKALLSKPMRFGDINQYIRPIKVSSILTAKREVAQTQIISLEDSIDIINLTKDFLENENAESLQYYDDMKSFPTVKAGKQIA